MPIQNRLYVRIVGEPYISRARTYKEQSLHAVQTWSAFALSLGAEQYFGLRCLDGLVFPSNKIPPDWRRPNRRGRSFPVKGSESARAIQELPLAPTTWTVFPEEDIPCRVRYGIDENNYGDFTVLGMWEPWVGWIGDDFYGIVADVARAAREFLAKTPGAKVADELTGWTLPLGLEVISKERYDYERARAALVARGEAA